ncbi:hypothetical protein [Novosphingobium olei]|uniref:hypothetical protein n=1 Tax=Novosphingobium olei TaxID=2728851 RepID=UPI0030937CE4|nr:hypothetical protein NSDW_17140 [Novosphingobium olei]
MTFKTPAPWFAAKRYGYGAGMPIAWQGWALLVTYIVAMALSNAMLSGWQRPVAMGVATVLLVVIASRRTQGGWRWRNGRD